MNKRQTLEVLNEVSAEITRLNRAYGETVFNPAATTALRSLIASIELPVVPPRNYVVTCRSRYPACFEKPGTIEVTAGSKKEAIMKAKRCWEADGADLKSSGGTIYKVQEAPVRLRFSGGPLTPTDSRSVRLKDGK